jgi:hypothetical protein
MAPKIRVWSIATQLLRKKTIKIAPDKTGRPRRLPVRCRFDPHR